jgi:O-antigen/teichoic acid export membrane protein
MFNKLKSIFISKFFKNSLAIIFGTGVAQFFPILFVPLISRLYTPSQYGEYALFVSVVSILSIFVTSHYNQAIMLPKTKENALELINICYTICVYFSGITFVGVFIFCCINNNFIFLLVPFVIFLLSTNIIMTIWNSKCQKYSVISKSKIISGISIVVFQILFYLLFKEIGLIIGYVCSAFIINVFLRISSKSFDFSIVNLKKHKPILLRYKYFLIYNLPADLSNGFIVNIPTFVLAKFVGKSAVGQYNFGYKILGAPISLFSTSVGEVFKQQAIESKQISNNCRTIFNQTLLILILISLPIFIILFFFAPSLFAFLLGEQWREAGVYTQILAPMYFFRFISSPLSYMYYVVEKLGENLLILVIMVVLTSFSLIAGYLINGTIYSMLIMYSTVYSVAYLFVLYRCYLFSR